MDSRDLDRELAKPKDQVHSSQEESHTCLGEAIRFQGHSENAAILQSVHQSGHNAKKSQFLKKHISIKIRTFVLSKEGSLHIAVSAAGFI